jgi:hypothetical protein
MNMCVQVPLLEADLQSFRYIPRIGIAGSDVSLVLVF